MAIRWTEEQYALFCKSTGRKISPKPPAQKKNYVIAGGYTSHVKGWRTIGGKKYYFKSLWEINYAYYLEWLKKRKEIFDWEYEPELFRFPTDAYKAGPFYYKPDFKVYLTKKSYEWHEIKGVLNSKSKKKIKRFEKHYPNEGKIIIIGKEWFSKANKIYPGVISGWETLPQRQRRLEAASYQRRR